MDANEWRKLLYLHAVKIAQARTKEELRDATRAGEAVARLAAAAGVKLDAGDTGGPPAAESGGAQQDPYDMPARKAAAWIARNGPPELRDDQVKLPESDE